jgi:6-pyruvoyltetrahydropterin/6-carboxytetrahydropterin synthase
LYVTVKGVASPDTGMVIDLKQLKKIIKEEIIDQLDHKNINEDVSFMKGIIPSIENIVVEIWSILDAKITNGKLHYIKLTETENNFVEYYGE